MISKHPILQHALFLILIVMAQAESAVRKDMEFSVTADVGFGNEVCVLGNHPSLGGGNPTRAPKLVWSSGNVWTGKIALEAGSTIGYQYISRNFATGTWGNITNATNIGAAQSLNTPAHENPPWNGKEIYYRSNWETARILYRDITHGGAWTEKEMCQWGPGRQVGEWTYRVDAVAPSGSELEFVFNNGAGTYDNAPAPPSGAAQGAAPAVPTPYQGLSAPYNFRTTLDVFLVQDDGVFNYFPQGTPGPPRFETRMVESTHAGAPRRPITIYLPRGYDQNTGKRYPVVYFHDGQNVFHPGGPFGTWDADRIATYEISQGRMREAILVAIPNGNDFGSNRLTEYLPNGETLTYASQTYTGNAAAYAGFLLNNIIPTLNFNYRTLTDAKHTITAGSSMGGLVSDYIGFSHSDRFGGIGIFSPAYWAAPNWVPQRDAALRLPLRRYLYMGTAESSTGESSSNIYWNGALQAYNAWMRVGHVVHRDLLFEGGAGAAHNEAAWARQLPAFFAFILDPWREGNAVTSQMYPPNFSLVDLNFDNSLISVNYMGFYGMNQKFWDSENLVDWLPQPLPSVEDWWNSRYVEVPLDSPAPASLFWKLSQDPWPDE